MAELNTDVWLMVLPYLANPIPPPLSHPHRLELRQPHLASCSRVCKYWNGLVTPLLYNHVVTDDFPRFCSHNGEPTKRHAFTLVKSLRIEYGAKGETATYFGLCENGGEKWTRCGLTGDEAQAARFADCEQETLRLLACFYSMGTIGMREAFPNLRSIAVAALYGKHHDYWLQYQQAVQGTEKQEFMTSCRDFFWRALSKSTIGTFCLRDHSGPLTLRSGTAYPTLPPNLNMHLSSIDLYLPAPLGVPVRWMSDMGHSTAWAETIHPMGCALDILSKGGRRKGDVVLDLDIYCSSDHYGRAYIDRSRGFAFNALGEPVMPYRKRGPILSLETQAAMCKDLGEKAQKGIRKASGKDDVVRWHTSSLAPPCQACGTDVAYLREADFHLDGHQLSRSR